MCCRRDNNIVERRLFIGEKRDNKDTVKSRADIIDTQIVIRHRRHRILKFVNNIYCVNIIYTSSMI